MAHTYIQWACAAHYVYVICVLSVCECVFVSVGECVHSKKICSFSYALWALQGDGQSTKMALCVGTKYTTHDEWCSINCACVFCAGHRHTQWYTQRIGVYLFIFYFSRGCYTLRTYKHTKKRTPEKIYIHISARRLSTMLSGLIGLGIYGIMLQIVLRSMAGATIWMTGRRKAHTFLRDTM